MVSKALNPVYRFLMEVDVRQVIPQNQSILFLHSNDSLESAVENLSNRGFLGAPVVDLNNACVGFIDMLDICAYITSVVPPDAHTIGDRAFNQDDAQLSREFYSQAHVQQVIDFSGRDPFVTCFEDNTLARLVELFQTGIQRIIIFNRNNQVTGFLSQTDVIRFLAKNVNREHLGLKDMAEIPFQTTGWIPGPAPVISQKASIFDAIRRLHIEGRSLAVVDDASGSMLGHFSARNLRGLYLKQFPRFNQTVYTYLRDYYSASLQSLSISPIQKFGAILNHFVDQHVHQFWVLNMKNQPIGVVSQTDILRICINYVLPLPLLPSKTIPTVPLMTGATETKPVSS